MFLHTTDLFRPYSDPDDHIDLAQAFILSAKGCLKLAGVIVDNPADLVRVLERGSPIQKQYLQKVLAGDPNPDIAAVAQLNELTHNSVPLIVGMRWPGGDSLPSHSSGGSTTGGVKLIVETLRSSRDPVAITVVGSCQDVAMAASIEPELFACKCSAVYVHCGSGSNEIDGQLRDGAPEYNVVLNPTAYAAMFDLPCPVYWVPCFDDIRTIKAGVHGGYFRVLYRDLLPNVPLPLKKYFHSVLSKSNASTWLSQLSQEKVIEFSEADLGFTNGVYSTAAFLHMAGMTVNRSGDLMDLPAVEGATLFDFVPIEVRCSGDGFTRWRRVEAHRDGIAPRYIIQIKDPVQYANVMPRVLISLLNELTSRAGGCSPPRS